MNLTAATGSALLALSALAPAAAAACSGTSPEHTLALVELYTSEGCDSCPPADRWLASLRARDPAGRQFAALAWHVDYWDHLGWKDPFADPRHSARQRRQAQLDASRVIYTPQVVLDGRDFRRWSSSAFVAEAARINAMPARARIGIEIDRPRAGARIARVRASVPDSALRAGARLEVVIVEDGLSSQVTRGENRGATLAHQHVVRASLAPLALDASGNVLAELALPAAVSAARASVLAFVQRDAAPRVLQAFSLPLSSCGNG